MPETTLLLHPFNNERQALWLCETLSQRLNAEIQQVGSHESRIAITASFQSSAYSLLNFLNSLSEVADAWEEATSAQPQPSLGALLVRDGYRSPDTQKVICVSLKPFQLQSGHVGRG